MSNRTGSLTPLLQVLVTLLYVTSPSFQIRVCGELIRLNQSTVLRTVVRVTDALFQRACQQISLPDQSQADRTNTAYRFPNVVGFIDGTQVHIQAPSGQEH